MLQLVDELMLLLQETADFHRPRNEAIARALDDVVQAIVRVHSRLRQFEGRYVVAFVGAANVGKSTLLNAVLGCEAAPSRNGPCTAAPIEFEFGEQIAITVHRRHCISRTFYRCANVEEIHGRLAKLVDDYSAQASQAISKVSVSLPSDVLRNKLVLADTPGFGAAQPGEADGSHERAVREYLQLSARQVFAVVLAEQGIGCREGHFFQQLDNVCDDIIVTGSEDWLIDEQRRFKQRFRIEIGGQMPRMHFVSGLHGIRARTRGDAAMLESAGITRLEHHIRSLARPHGRLESLTGRILQIAEDVGEWLANRRDERNQPLSTRWRRDSWSRWLGASPDCAFKRHLTARLQWRPL
ncbi:MAG TPA: dynamin family protein [Lacipirellulaceae bacterium]|nr:dynamin family protein [Lacipirellulaceae bacterium]